MPNDRRVEIKIGIHIGDVVHRGCDVYGDGVNIASRIEPLAGAGGICVSMDVERQIRNALEARFEKLAPTELKNISVAMDLFRIVLPWETPAKAAASASGRASPVGRWAGVAILLLLAVGVAQRQAPTLRCSLIVLLSNLLTRCKSLCTNSFRMDVPREERNDGTTF